MLSLMTAGAQTELLIPPEVVASSLPNPATPKPVTALPPGAKVNLPPTSNHPNWSPADPRTVLSRHLDWPCPAPEQLVLAESLVWVQT